MISCNLHNDILWCSNYFYLPAEWLCVHSYEYVCLPNDCVARTMTHFYICNDLRALTLTQCDIHNDFFSSQWLFVPSQWTVCSHSEAVCPHNDFAWPSQWLSVTITVTVQSSQYFVFFHNDFVGASQWFFLPFIMLSFTIAFCALSMTQSQCMLIFCVLSQRPHLTFVITL
jgi:hypothetical protein